MLFHSNSDWFSYSASTCDSIGLKIKPRRRTKRRNAAVASGKQSFVCEPSLIAVTHSIVQLPNSLVSNNDSSF